jgi:hypothetical protein
LTECVGINYTSTTKDPTMTSHAATLITAIQSCNPRVVRDCIQALKAVSEAEVAHLPKPDQRAWGRKNHINDTWGGLNLTALHVAAKAYSAHCADPRLAQAFDTMVGDLLAAGANPFLEAGGKKQSAWINGTRIVGAPDGGQTTVELCEGKVPPALAAHLAQHCDDNLTSNNHGTPVVHSTRLKKVADRVSSWRARHPHLAAVL